MRESILKAEHERVATDLCEQVSRDVADGTITTRATLAAEVEWLPYGVTESSSTSGDDVTEIVATYGLVESEYAAIRKGAALLDRNHRATITLKGSERIAFLERMLTQKLSDMQPGDVRQSFWLNRQGRISADMLVVQASPEMTLLDLDHAQAAATAASLESFLFAEDVTIVYDDSDGDGGNDAWGRLALHGPLSLQCVASAVATPPASPLLLADRASTTVEIAGSTVQVARIDQAGEVGLELFMPRSALAAVWNALRSSAAVDGTRVRPIGWYAWNIARIEAGTPLFNIDFGTTNLPHEAGPSVLASRVSFTKGCYLGQEIVARMHNLGRPKQTLIGLRMGDDADPALPVAGAQVFAADENQAGTPIGTVTSSTLSPMLGAAAVGFAMVRTKHATEGSQLIVHADGKAVTATVSPMVFWTRSMHS